MDKHVLVTRGKRYLDDGQYQDASEAFEQAIKLDGSDPDLWNDLGVALRSLGRYDESIKCFNRSLEIEPRDGHS